MHVFRDQYENIGSEVPSKVNIFNMTERERYKSEIQKIVAMNDYKAPGIDRRDTPAKIIQVIRKMKAGKRPWTWTLIQRNY